MISKLKFNMVAVFVLALGVFAGAALAQDTTTSPNNTQKQDRPGRHGGFDRHGDGARRLVMNVGGYWFSDRVALKLCSANSATLI